jgi:hypothetical protein
MRHIASSIFLVLILHVAAPSGRSQQASWSRQSGGSSSPAQTHGGRAAPAARPAAPARGTSHDASFPTRLGNNVGLRTFPAVSVPVGVGNINHPGVAPATSAAMPSQIGAGSSYPNINFPGGTPTVNSTPAAPPRWDTTWDGRNPGHRRRADARPPQKVIYYGVPYYVPYIVYTQTPAPDAPAVYDAPPLDPGPHSGTVEVQPHPALIAQAPREQAGEPTITLLAFKDSTVLAVVEYWLEGDSLWYRTDSGVTASTPLAQLDLPLTQRLNRERSVRFVLESRP